MRWTKASHSGANCPPAAAAEEDGTAGGVGVSTVVGREPAAGGATSEVADAAAGGASFDLVEVIQASLAAADAVVAAAEACLTAAGAE